LIFTYQLHFSLFCTYVKLNKFPKFESPAKIVLDNFRGTLEVVQLLYILQDKICNIYSEELHDVVGKNKISYLCLDLRIAQCNRMEEAKLEKV
jgi:hypothetical protein